MRLLFIDFDGVCHPATPDLEANARFQWLPTLAQLLAPWPDVRIAVHSTWRYDHSDAELASLLGPLGSRYVGSVPRGAREDSILWFLHMVPGKDHSYRVLDDAAVEFNELSAPQLILCDPLLGVSATNVQEQLRAWLEVESVEAADADRARAR